VILRFVVILADSHTWVCTNIILGIDVSGDAAIEYLIRLLYPLIALVSSLTIFIASSTFFTL
jgi:hypothetical protein